MADVPPVTDVDYDAALRAIDECLVVGLTERFDETLLVLGANLGWSLCDLVYVRRHGPTTQSLNVSPFSSPRVDAGAGGQFHSITSLARRRMDVGTSRPIAFGGLYVDHQLALRRVLRRQIAGLGALDAGLSKSQIFATQP